MSTHAHSTSPGGLQALLEGVAHLLPEQAPLHTFVHHNTLHAFEDLPFERAVVEAAVVYGAQPFQTEAAFAEHLRKGRILAADLDDVIAEDLRRSADPDTLVIGRLTRRAYRELRLRNLFEIPSGAALEWQLVETDTLARVHPHVDDFRRRELEVRAEQRFAGLPPRERVGRMLWELWEHLARAAPEALPSATATRRRDQLVAAGLEDVDQRVHPLLIRWSAAFLDQGVASWPMPGREQGFLSAVRRLQGLEFSLPEPWMAGLADEFRRQEAEHWDAERTARAALVGLGAPEHAWGECIRTTLLSLRGWAGMMRQFELRPDRAPVEPRPAKLLDFLAVQLTLDLFAARHAVRSQFGARAGWAPLEAAQPRAGREPDLTRVYEAFVMAQVTQVQLESFASIAHAARWMAEVAAFGELERRRLLHLAFERRLRVSVLDAVAAYVKRPDPPLGKPKLQAIFCIDERECSTRRHLEELQPNTQTFGFAGFFGVAMAWQGLGEVRPRPLCPVNLTPRHYVTERALSADEEQAWRSARRRRGLTTQALTLTSRTVGGGGLLSAFFGLGSVLPMIGRCLFPRLSESLLGGITDAARLQPVTRLMLERVGDERDAEGRFVGYSIPEMADVVENALRTIGLTSGFSEIVLIVGHGSSSLNNPHESAYDCGATGGGRGGPNARAFAAMANHPAVRALLRQRGLELPDESWFVGALHNTCNDSMEWFDEDLMPEARQPALEAAKTLFETVCERQAHERCRRFESAPRDGDPAAALRHVKGRAVDLAQPRPECGHATNAYAIVGRRERTRGLFLDRRPFLISYDPTTDPTGAILARLLAAVVPVGAGINLEYYFSYVDPLVYGAGTKLPHNITGLIGVMDGHASDLRTGLPWQMVEIHEPVRLLAIIDAEPEVLRKLLAQAPDMARFISNGWIQVAAVSPSTGEVWRFVDGDLRPYEPESKVLPVVPSSIFLYRGEFEHLGCARIVPSSADEDAA